MNGWIFRKHSSNYLRLFNCPSFNSPVCLFSLAICIGLCFSLIDFISQFIRFITIFYYNWCKMSDNRMAWMFIWQWSYIKHSYGCNQSPNTLFYYFIRLFCCFLSCDHIDLYIRGCHDFASFSYSSRKTWQIEYYTFTFILVIRPCSS